MINRLTESHDEFKSYDELCPVCEKTDLRDPDYSRSGIFATHNCWKCKDGVEPCVAGNPRRCEYPHARND